MKIVAGLGSIDEYERFVEAGADEFFCGYVPYFWSKKYGTVLPLNRREVLCYNVQIGSFSELEILAAMVRKYRKPVHLTFNSLYYIPEQYPEIAEMIQHCMALGFHSYIIADPALMVYLREHNIDCDIHISGETGEINSQMMAALAKLHPKRLIFHRKNTFEDMESVIRSCRNQRKNSKQKDAEKEMLNGEKEQENQHKVLPVTSEFEAFVLNELCQFTGAFCNSLHCDEMGYLCRVPYILGRREDEKTETRLKLFSDRIKNKCEDEENDSWHVDEASGENISSDEKENDEMKSSSCDDYAYLCGETGCGLCALYQLQKAGITHLKLVGRGNYVDYMENDIRSLKCALNILDQSQSEADFITKMKSQLFPDGCSKNCYYV